MLNILSNLTAIAAAAAPIFITDSTGKQTIDIAHALCRQLQPVQMYEKQSDPTTPSQLFNLVLVNSVEFQIQSNTCPGFSISYPGESTGAEPIRAQTILKSASQVFFTIPLAIPGKVNGPFNIIYQSVEDGPLYLTGWNPNLTYASTGPLTFEFQNAGDVRQQWQFISVRTPTGLDELDSFGRPFNHGQMTFGKIYVASQQSHIFAAAALSDIYDKGSVSHLPPLHSPIQADRPFRLETMWGFDSFEASWSAFQSKNMYDKRWPHLPRERLTQNICGGAGIAANYSISKYTHQQAHVQQSVSGLTGSNIQVHNNDITAAQILAIVFCSLFSTMLTTQYFTLVLWPRRATYPRCYNYIRMISTAVLSIGVLAAALASTVIVAKHSAIITNASEELRDQLTNVSFSPPLKYNDFPANVALVCLLWVGCVSAAVGCRSNVPNPNLNLLPTDQYDSLDNWGQKRDEEQ
ncbi:hypothetical protein BDP27DRAFT_1427047 [Rhodocollybia butyracea]|uniref:Uncharacterized protein n=1 Tax=Rhodocollybia butyracea TaxID=206335 RepID=A0A9P5PCT2_9AGAR|nr:hypothetical protein BDP27DRAFT_1427047 [Rhodocollybia butyracea]